jgi:hypothetical protein
MSWSFRVAVFPATNMGQLSALGKISGLIGDNKGCPASVLPRKAVLIQVIARRRHRFMLGLREGYPAGRESAIR